MSDTTANIEIGSTPVSVATATSITAGTAIRIANVGGHPMRYAIGTASPDKTGYRIMPRFGYGSIVEIAAGESDVWCWVDDNYDKSFINVELS